MSALENWLNQATRRLAKDSIAQVRTEIQDHYESARDAAIQDGASAADADRLAVMALGDPVAANRQYRQVLLTSAEGQMLASAKWEARAVCSRPWLKRLLLTLPIAALLASAALFSTGSLTASRLLLVGGVGMGLLVAGPLLPVYTPARGRAFRLMKWSVLAGTLIVAFGPDVLRLSWLLACCFWPVFHTEWTRHTIRRKLRVTEWPKSLYL